MREIDERMLADGTVYRPIDETQVAQAARELSAAGCSAIAISFLHAYANGAHERIARRVVEGAAPGTYVSTSHEVWPQRREYERSSVTVINTYVGQRMSEYFGALEREPHGIGITAPLLSTKSNGGTMSARSAAQNPGRNAVLRAGLRRDRRELPRAAMDEHRVITLDMGGTSADVSVYADGYQYSTEATAGDFPDPASGDRHLIHWGRRRFHRVDRRDGRAESRSQERRRGAGTGLLRAWRHGAAVPTHT